jgi:hypothetical protein
LRRIVTAKRGRGLGLGAAHLRIAVIRLREDWQTNYQERRQHPDDHYRRAFHQKLSTEN